MRGSCLCGTVEFYVLGNGPVASHRRPIQKPDGSVSHLAAPVRSHQDWFHVIKGSASLKRKLTREGNNRLMCDHCDTIVL